LYALAWLDKPLLFPLVFPLGEDPFAGGVGLIERLFRGMLAVSTLENSAIRPVVSLLFGLSVMFAAIPASVADLGTGWTTGYSTHPIFKCPAHRQNETSPATRE
jgi:hypothetical protein